MKPVTCNLRMAVDSVTGNVHDLASVLEEVVVPPYQVLPGLCEAMLWLPSGLVVQPVEQKLWKMLPVVGVRRRAARMAGRPLRFKTREA